MRVSGSLSSSLVLCGHVQGITAPGSLWACPNVQRRVTLLGMAGLSLYFPIPVESYLQGTKSQNWPRIVGKEMIHGGDQGPRSGPKPQGSRGLSPYGTQFAGQRTWNIHGQEEETSSCFGHSWADGETGRPNIQSFTSANDPTSYIPICEMGTVRPTWLSEQGHGKGFVIEVL